MTENSFLTPSGNIVNCLSTYLLHDAISVPARNQSSSLILEGLHRASTQHTNRQCIPEAHYSRKKENHLTSSLLLLFAQFKCMSPVLPNLSNCNDPSLCTQFQPENIFCSSGSNFGKEELQRVLYDRARRPNIYLWEAIVAAENRQIVAMFFNELLSRTFQPQISFRIKL